MYKEALCLAQCKEWQVLQTHLQSHKNLTRHDMQAQCHTDRSPSTFSADVSSAVLFLEGRLFNSHPHEYHPSAAGAFPCPLGAVG